MKGETLTNDPDPESGGAAAAPTETIEELRRSFFYGSRSNLNFKFLKDLSDDEFGRFLDDLLWAVAETTNSGDPSGVIETALSWQITAYRNQVGEPDDFPHRYMDTPINPLPKPLNQCRLTLVTSSGHFVDGDDPEPFGVANMSQQEAEDRIGEFLKAAPRLSSIPIDVDPGSLRVRHGGYPVHAVASDHQVALPLGHLQELADDGTIGELNPTAYSFVGAASQVRLKKQVAPRWAELLRDDGTDVVLLVPV